MAGELTPSPVRASAQEPSITEIEARLKEVEELLAAEPAHCWCRYCTKLNVEADALRKGVAALTAAEARGRQQAEQARDGERMNARQPISDQEARDLQQTSDGAKWANAFCRATGFPDEGWALSWFCNAIMAQYDECRRREDATVAALTQALKDLRDDASRLCDRQLGGTYEEDCRHSIAKADAALTGAQA